MRVAVTGASGKTGRRVVEEALKRGLEVRAILRPSSIAPEGILGAAIERLELQDVTALERALQGCDALVIATGARPSIDLLAPLKVDALAIRPQYGGGQGRWSEAGGAGDLSLQWSSAASAQLVWPDPGLERSG